MSILKPIPELVKELDRVFSIYIRQRDTNDAGFGKCVTCNHTGHYKSMDCGHYISRREYQTRWDERNCALQCKFCNYSINHQGVFAEAINKRWGEGTTHELHSKRRVPMKLDRIELNEQIIKLKDKINSPVP